ncbi:MAG: hypothetical protein IJ546_05715 [Prevotella sp.]|nr:hypothetical protein [Prevotella sp.]MBR0274692.1 hypothetical protein [Prevotella sp.]
MKKILLTLIVIIVVAVVGFICYMNCGNDHNTDQEDAPAQTEQSATVNDVSTDLQAQLATGDAEQLVAQVSATIEKAKQLATEGKTEEAKAYIEQAQTFINDNMDAIKALPNSDIEGMGLIDWFASAAVDELLMDI